MGNNPGNKLPRPVLNRVIFTVLATMMLIVLGWLSAWWLKGHSAAALHQINYFANPFRIVFLAYIFIEETIDLFWSPRNPQPRDEIIHSWYHWRLVMWETILVLAVFSDLMGILPVSENFMARWVGIGLLVISLILYAKASLDRSISQKSNPDLSFPTRGIFHSLHFPDSLSAFFTAFGTAFIFNSWVGIFLAVLTTVILIGHVNSQDLLMLEKYASPWADYQSKVKKGIPFIW
jgi:protein-S-isoprenylcysteine O-methyltransferase Ste14